MFGADDEVRIEGPGRRRVGLLALQLVQEALGEIERRIGLDRVLALPDPDERRERGRRERGQRPRLVDGRRPRLTIAPTRRASKV